MDGQLRERLGRRNQAVVDQVVERSVLHGTPGALTIHIESILHPVGLHRANGGQGGGQGDGVHLTQETKGEVWQAHHTQRLVAEVGGEVAVQGEVAARCLYDFGEFHGIRVFFAAHHLHIARHGVGGIASHVSYTLIIEGVALFIAQEHFQLRVAAAGIYPFKVICTEEKRLRHFPIPFLRSIRIIAAAAGILLIAGTQYTIVVEKVEVVL